MARRVLLATIGQAPQIVTETVWALINKRVPPWLPTEIHVVTTTFAAEKLVSALRSSDGPLGMLYGHWPPLTVHVPARDRPPLVVPPLSAKESHGAWRGALRDGRLLRDVSSEHDSAIMGDYILRLAWSAVRDPNSELHVSLAGGRKTMSAHALLASTLVGRAQDQASHVLVSPADF